MRKLFVSLYVVLVITFIVVGWSLDQIFDRWFESSNPTNKIPLYENISGLVTDQLNTTNTSKWHDILSNIQDRLEIDASIEHLDDFLLNDSSQEVLTQGEVIYLSDGENIYLHQRIGNSQKVFSLGPIKANENAKAPEIALAVVFYICLGIALFLWFWPLWNNLNKLNKTTNQFGQGNFSVRANLPVKSSLYNMGTTFNNMADRIQSLLQSQKELSNAISHELRTPISRLRFSMEMLTTAQTKNAQEKYIEEMNTDVDELEKLVDEMLTYARLDNDTPHLDIVESQIQPIITELLNKIKQEHPNIFFDTNTESLEKKISLDIDQRLFVRALENLLLNAGKYTKSKVRLDIYLKNHSCEIHIEDDGPGIDLKDRQRVFEPFVRLDSARDRSKGGSGLGLTIVNRIVQWHKGKIWVEDSPMGGACFCLRLPLSEI